MVIHDESEQTERTHIARTACHITRLPYELVLELATYLSADDIVSLLSTCKVLRTHYRDETIWRRLCARYGVTDRSIFGTYPWFTIYSTLLHTYGALLGLWASDQPFKGNVMEYRLGIDQRGHPSIIGEVWKFRDSINIDVDDNDLEEPSLPTYTQSFVIPLIGDGTRAFNKPRPRDFIFHVHDENAPWRENSTSTYGVNAPSFRYLSSNFQSTGIHLRPFQHRRTNRSDDASYALHPDFPDYDDDPWFDKERELLRLKQQPSALSPDSRVYLTNGNFPSSVPYLYTVRTDHENPPAFSIFPHPAPMWHDFLHLHDPPHGIVDLRGLTAMNPRDPLNSGVPARYYPLRGPKTSPHRLGEVDWTYADLEGIWLGAYGSHGTEVLYVNYDEEENEVRAVKVTGDQNVPRGVHSWSFRVGRSGGDEDMDVLDTSAFGNIDVKEIHRGAGTVSAPGFMPNARSRTRATVALVNEDDIRIDWVYLRSVSRFRRYKGRDLDSEIVVKPGVRQATRWL
ncbi:hypothetical protein K474DRAFT_1772513 [Panus rudis PR-1116 ss-1]|nr:hypothetical protein K474DRAFT_1772513 [Panus rudis PR-1116 ss-1]